MRHGMANKKLNRTSEHRKALLKNMLNSLIKYEQIKTTLPKAKFLKPKADKIITNLKQKKLVTLTPIDAYTPKDNTAKGGTPKGTQKVHISPEVAMKLSKKNVLDV